MSRAAALKPSDIVIFGGTGDLCRRKIIPALYYRLKEKQLPPTSRIWLLGRGKVSEKAHLAFLKDACTRFVDADDFTQTAFNELAKRTRYLKVDALCADDFTPLASAIEPDARPVRIFYLSTAANLFAPICQHLKQTGLLTAKTRIVLEKPIGSDLGSFRSINHDVLECVKEEQIYRIDHYLGKETVQNLMVLRFANHVFESMWHGKAIDHVQITVAESTGLENRHSYYDEAGALRDMVQNHLLQLLCLIAMEPPNQVTPDAIRDEKLKVLRSLRPITPKNVAAETVRGQYDSGRIKGKKMPAYLDEIGLPKSNTETFVALKVWLDNWRWSGVPFYLRSGKAMAERYSEIVIQFAPVPHAIFPDQIGHPDANKLVIRLQPDESVKFQIITKVPGPGGYRLKPVNLNLSLADEFTDRYPGAYERLLMDVVRGNPTLFMRSDEVEEAWRWVETILDSWQTARIKPALYAAGTMGPKSADSLMFRDGRAWYGDG